jgi:hypothetical protein
VIALEADSRSKADCDGTGARVITVNGNLLATGGNGVGSATDATAEGGSGGRIALTAGVLADEGGSIALGSARRPVRLDASGGRRDGRLAAMRRLDRDLARGTRRHRRARRDAGDRRQHDQRRTGRIRWTGRCRLDRLRDRERHAPRHRRADRRCRRRRRPVGHGRHRHQRRVPQFSGQGGSAGQLDVSVAGAGKAIQVLGAVSGDGGNGTFGRAARAAP